MRLFDRETPRLEQFLDALRRGANKGRRLNLKCASCVNLACSLLMFGQMHLGCFGIIAHQPCGTLSNYPVLDYLVVGASFFGAMAGFSILRWTGPSGTFTPRGFLVDLLLPPDRAEDVLYNLLGRYPHWVEKHGLPKARLIFLVQSMGAILSFWSDWVLKRARLLRFLRPF